MTFAEACEQFEAEMRAERVKYGLRPDQPWTQEVVNKKNAQWALEAAAKAKTT